MEAYSIQNEEISMYKDIDFDRIDLTQAPPAEETARQYYYIGKIRNHIRELSEELSRTLTASVKKEGRTISFSVQTDKPFTLRLVNVQATSAEGTEYHVEGNDTIVTGCSAGKISF